jgi:hypothetical protein
VREDLVSKMGEILKCLDVNEEKMERRNLRVENGKWEEHT